MRKPAPPYRVHVLLIVLLLLILAVLLLRRGRPGGGLAEHDLSQDFRLHPDGDHFFILLLPRFPLSFRPQRDVLHRRVLVSLRGVVWRKLDQGSS